MEPLAQKEVALRILSMYEGWSIDDFENQPSLLVYNARQLRLIIQVVFKSEEINEPGMIGFLAQLENLVNLMERAAQCSRETPDEVQHFKHQNYIKKARHEVNRMLGFKSKVGAAKENSQLILFKVAKLICDPNAKCDTVNQAAQIVAKELDISERTVARIWTAHCKFLQLPIVDKLESLQII